MAMFKTCKATIKRIDPALCGNRTVLGSSETFKCSGHCADCRQGCRPVKSTSIISLASKGKKVCEVDPDYMYVHVSGLHGSQKCAIKDHPGHGQFSGNSNGDFFWWNKTLLAYNDRFGMRAFETWRGKDNLENHDETKVIGDIPDVWPSLKDRSIDMLIRTSKRRAWSTCESVRKGSVTDVSMGTLVNFSLCSICANKAETEEEWCDHLLHAKGHFLPVDELIRKDRALFPKGKWSYEDNREIYGIETSWITVGEGADDLAVVKNLIAGMEGPRGEQFAKKNKKNASMADLFWDKWGNKY